MSVESPRPPRYSEAVDLYLDGKTVRERADSLPEFSPARTEGYARATALFAQAQAAGILRLIAPVTITPPVG